MSKLYLSPTQINMFTRCGEQYRRRYIEGEKLPPGISLIRGSSVHKGAEHNFKQKMGTRKDLSKNDIVDISVASFEERVKNEGVMLNEIEKSRGKEIVIGEAKDTTVALSSLYAEVVAPKYQPKMVEEETIIELPHSTHDLKGIIDLVDENDLIVDLKTGSRKKSQEEVDKDAQMTFYSMIHKAKTGKAEKGIVIEQLLDQKKPKNETILTTRNEADYKAMINRINAVAHAINSGIFPPAQPDSWSCSAKFCGWYHVCQFIKH